MQRRLQGQCRLDLDVGGGKAAAGCLRWPVSTMQASASSCRLWALAPAPAADVCPRRARGPAPALFADAEPPCCINEPFVAQHTVPTDFTITTMQREFPCRGKLHIMGYPISQQNLGYPSFDNLSRHVQGFPQIEQKTDGI